MGRSVVPWYAVKLEIAYVGRVDLEGRGSSVSCMHYQMYREGPHRLKVILPALRIDQVKVRHGFKVQDGGATTTCNLDGRRSDRYNTQWRAAI